MRLKDVKPEAAARGLKTAHDTLVKRAKRKKAKPFQITAVTDRVAATTEYTGFHTADVVVEAVFEDVAVKHTVMKEIEAHIGEGTVLGSNTSTIPIAKLAEASSRPDHVIGLHFFSPVDRMPLLEIITHPGTAPWVTATSHAYGKKIGKTPIIVNDSPAFANRILSPYMARPRSCCKRACASRRSTGRWGVGAYPVGPITLYDEVGLDVAQKAGRSWPSLLRRMTPVDVIDRMVATSGWAGRTLGASTSWRRRKKTGVDEAVYALTATRRRSRWSGPRSRTGWGDDGERGRSHP